MPRMVYRRRERGRGRLSKMVGCICTWELPPGCNVGDDSRRTCELQPLPRIRTQSIEDPGEDISLPRERQRLRCASPPRADRNPCGIIIVPPV